MATFLFRSERAYAEALLAGWTPVRWEIDQWRQYAALRMQPPTPVNSRGIMQLASAVLDRALLGCRHCHRHCAERTSGEEHARALKSLEEKFGPRPVNPTRG